MEHGTIWTINYHIMIQIMIQFFFFGRFCTTILKIWDTFWKGLRPILLGARCSGIRCRRQGLNIDMASLEAARHGSPFTSMPGCGSKFQTQGNPTFFRYLNLVVRCMTIQSMPASFGESGFFKLIHLLFCRSDP